MLESFGGFPSANLIGDVQVVSNIESPVVRATYELWVKQSLGNFFLLTGLHDMNSEFFVREHAANFINSSFGISPGLSLNLPVSIYPVTTAGALTGYGEERVGFTAGLYNLNDDFADAKSFFVNDHDFTRGYFAIGEFRYGRNSEEGIAKMGMFTARYDDIEGVRLSRSNHGYYILAEKSVLQGMPRRNLNIFFHLSGHPRKKSYISSYLGAGRRL